MKRQKQIQTGILLVIFLLFGGYANAQQKWEIPYKKYPNGNLRIAQIKEGKKLKKSIITGYKMFYNTGEVRAEMTKENDKLYHWKEYYRNGQLGAIGDSRIDIIKIEMGLWKTYHKNGQLKQEIFFDGGSKSGDYKEYYETGVLKITGQFGLVGAYKGVWTYYNENGEVKSTKDFGEKFYYIKPNTEQENKNDFDEVFDLLEGFNVFN